MQLIHKQTLLFLLEKTQRNQKNGAVIKESNIDWQNELKPSFAILSTLWSAIEDKYYMWNQFVVIVLIWSTPSFYCQVFSGLCLSVCLLDLLQCTVWHWLLKMLAFLLLWVTFSDCVPLLRDRLSEVKALNVCIHWCCCVCWGWRRMSILHRAAHSCTSYTAKSDSVRPQGETNLLWLPVCKEKKVQFGTL